MSAQTKTVRFRIEGLRPLVMHNGILADVTNSYAKAMRAITSKGSKKMTDKDHEERDWLEWQGGAYWSTELNGFYIPSDNIERCLLEGAKRSRKGKAFQAAAFCAESEIEIDHRLSGKSQEEIYKDPGYTHRKGVKVTQSRVIRIRPMIPTGWVSEFSIEYDPSIINESDIVSAMSDAGALVGLGDWRPKFGRFSVEVFK